MKEGAGGTERRMRIEGEGERWEWEEGVAVRE